MTPTHRAPLFVRKTVSTYTHLRPTDPLTIGTRNSLGCLGGGSSIIKANGGERACEKEAQGRVAEEDR